MYRKSLMLFVFGIRLLAQAPSLISLTPNAGGTASQVFTLQFSDAAGYQDFQHVQMRITANGSEQNSCHVYYFAQGNQFQLLGDDGASSAGTIPVGSSSNVSNHQCQLRGVGSTVNGSGTTLTVTFSLNFLSYAGGKDIYVEAMNWAGQAVPWPKAGIWSVPGNYPPPSFTSLTPNAGTGASQVFTLQFSDAAGYQDFQLVQMRLTGNGSEQNSCHVYYLVQSNQFQLLGDDGATSAGTIPVGSSSHISNTQCRLFGLGSTVNGSGTSLTVTFSLSFLSSFTGGKDIYVEAMNWAGQGPWQGAGMWSVPNYQAPSLISLSPNAGTGASQVFTLQLYDAASYQDFQLVQMRLTGNGLEQNSCHVYYLVQSNQFQLLGDDGASSAGTLPVGSSSNVSNTQCRLFGLGSTVNGSGTSLTVTFSLSFLSFTGGKDIYVEAMNWAGQEVPWQKAGQLTVPVPSAVTTADYDIGRTGSNVNELTLTTSNVNNNQFGLLWQGPVDGFVYAHPLYVPGILINYARHNVIYVATAHDTLYAFDADGCASSSCTPLWSHNYGPIDDYALGAKRQDEPPTPPFYRSPAGIVGTPTIDVTQKVIYFVSNPTGCPGSPPDPNCPPTQNNQYLHAVDIATGVDRIPPVPITDSAGQFKPLLQLQRPALLLDTTSTNQKLWICFGSYNDQGYYQGWIFSYSTVTSAQPLQRLSSHYLLPPTYNNWGTGVWMSGGGPALDPTGNYVFFTTGNKVILDANQEGPPAYDNSIIGVSNLTESIFSFAVLPAENISWDTNDWDLGSSRAIHPPFPSTSVFSGSKQGDIFEIRDVPQGSSFPLIQRSSVCEAPPSVTDQIFAGLAYWSGRLYTWCSSDVLRRWDINSQPQRVLSNSATGSLGAPVQGATLAISANGSSGSAIVWATVPTSDPAYLVPGWLVAYEADGLYKLYQSNFLNGFRFQKFTPPVIAYGRVYVSAIDYQNNRGVILVYGLGGTNSGQ